MARRVLIEGMLFLGIGAVGLFEGCRLTLEKESHLTYDVLGPGGFVFIISLLIMITGVVHLMSQRRESRSVEKATEDKEMRIRVLSMIGVFAIYNVLTQYVGYFVGSIVFFLLEFRIVGIKSWSSNAILTLALTAAYYVIFVYFAGIPLPRTILF